VVTGLTFGPPVTACAQISKCPVGKEKITVAILTTYRLRITVNWLRQKYLHVSPIMLEWRCLQRQNIETEYKRSCGS